jgi:hypothetical protein
MLTPKGPLFIVSKKPRSFDFQAKAKTHIQATRLTLISTADSACLAFDSAGTVWSFCYERPPGGFSALARFLAHTFYNPVSRVSITWAMVRPYDFEELSQHYLAAIADDDDVLTQFVERDELCARVRACSTFAEMVATWRWQNTDTAFDDQPKKST